MNPEYRHAVKGLELREAAKGFIGAVRGYAAKFDSFSKDFGGFTEVIRKGAFSRSLKLKDDMHDVRALLQHQAGQILGRRSAGTLTVEEDDRGLAIEISLIDTTRNRDTLADIRAGNLDAMSFGFIPRKHAWVIGRKEGEPSYRELLDVDLLEVSVVTWAQYNDTELSARSLVDEFHAEKNKLSATPLSLLRQRQAFLNLNT